MTSWPRRRSPGSSPHVMALTGRGWSLRAHVAVSRRRRRHCCGGSGAARRHRGRAVADAARRRGGIVSHHRRRPVAARLRPGSGGACLRAGDAGAARPQRLAVRRRHEPPRCARRFRHPRRRGVSDRLGNHELRRRRHDPQREAVGRCRPAGPVHAGLLEVGAVALLLAILLLAVAANSFAFDGFGGAAAICRSPMRPSSACCSSSASAPSSGCCRSTSGFRTPMAPAAARPAP